MTKSLRDIKAPILKELEQFESHFQDSMQSSVSLLYKITYYIVRRKGKQIRPMFVFLCASLCGKINEATYDAASMVELVHTASLVHDDVVDDSNKRRGFFSVNALWKNKIAVLVGDYLLSRGILITVKNGRYKFLEILSNAVQDMAEGELLQIEKARRLDIDESVYYEVIRQKTASLIAAACGVGAASTSDDPEIIDRLITFGEKIGIAFQIRDDLFDFGTEEVGKPLGIDIKEKKMTLPLIFALKESDKSQQRHIINLVRNHSENPKKVKEVIEFVRSSGGLEFARQAMNQFRNEAFELLHHFPPSEVRDSLEDLVMFVTERKK